MNPADRARAVFADNAAPNACAADLLCDRHKAAPPRSPSSSRTCPRGTWPMPS